MRSASICRYSVRTVPRVDAFFDVFVGGSELHIFLLYDLDHPPYIIFNLLFF